MDDNTKSIKASDLFVKALENEGVEYVFGIPGEENLELLDSLSRSSIKLVLRWSPLVQVASGRTIQ